MPAGEEPPQGAQAFQELQIKYFNNTAQLKHVSPHDQGIIHIQDGMPVAQFFAVSQVAQQLQNTIKTGRRAALTLEQLNSMGDVSNTYVALGKT